MSYKNPNVPLIENAINLDAAIQKIQVALSSLPWLERSYGKSSTGAEKRIGEKAYLYPEVYVGEGKYMTLEPNNFLSSHSFFKQESALKPLEYSFTKQSQFSCRVSIIFWLNLDKIKKKNALTYSHRFTEELKADVLKVLRTCSAFELLSIYEEPKEIFKGYSWDIVGNQTFKHPEAGFRFEGELTFQEKC